MSPERGGGKRGKHAWLLGFAGLLVLVALVRLYGDAVKDQYALSRVEAPPLELNQASFGELMTLPGIQEALAARIVGERRRGGPFKDAADLAERVAGIGEKKLADLLPHVIIR